MRHCVCVRARACTRDEFEILQNNSLPRLMIIIIINIIILNFKHITHTLYPASNIILYYQMHVVTCNIICA